MSFKYCFNKEIHKTFNLPPDFASLLAEVNALFVQKLPSSYILQYQDSDGDRIAITNDKEYQTLIKHELPMASYSIKIFITPLLGTHSSDRRSTCTPRSNSNGSFELVEEDSFNMDEIVDIVPSEEEEVEKKSESKVVVSLKIPESYQLRPRDSAHEELESLEEAQSFKYSSANEKSKISSRSRDLVQEMSLREEQERSCVSRTEFNKAHETEEENLSLCGEDQQGTEREVRKVIRLEIPEFRERDSGDLREYFNKGQRRLEDDTEEKEREKDQERWVSLSSDRQKVFTLRQRPEAYWFMCTQDRSNRYQENEEEEEKTAPAEIDKEPEAKALRDEQVEEWKGKYRDLNRKRQRQESQQASIEMSFGDEANGALEDTLYYPQYKDQGKPPGRYSIQRLCELMDRSPRSETGSEDSRDNVENMNVSLLTASEARRIASAIGSMHRLEGLKKLRICSEPGTPEKVGIQTSPVFFKRECRRQDSPIQDDWPFLEAKEKGSEQREGNTGSEASFCIGCWESPIRGPRFVCLVCEDIELCENCEARMGHCHPLLKIKGQKRKARDGLDELAQTWGRSLELEDMYEGEEDHKFEYREISSTPLMIKSNKKEWCVVYKTICVRNTGRSMWRRCHFEPVGFVPGTITEVQYVGQGDSVLVTLEIHGFFAPGKYESTWRVVHQGDMDKLCEMGYIDLEFEVVENKNGLAYEQPVYEKGIEEEEF